eukprot:3514225-Prymnesium_polylepis.2
MCLVVDTAQLGERRPRFAGRHAECHKFVPELSGSSAPTNNVEPSSPRLHISLHPIGGVLQDGTRPSHQ